MDYCYCGTARQDVLEDIMQSQCRVYVIPTLQIYSQNRLGTVKTRLYIVEMF